MYIKEILTYFKKEFKNLFKVALIGGILGFIFFLFPKKYETSGSLYITRKTESGFYSYFKYEGFYAQQNAQNQMLNIISIMQSDSIRSKVLEFLDIKVTKENLLKLNKELKIKKSAPQIINISSYSYSKEKSKNTWIKLVNITNDTINRINYKNGDSDLQINILSYPVTTIGYYNLYLCIILGSGLSLSLYLTILYINPFKKINNKKESE